MLTLNEPEMFATLLDAGADTAPLLRPVANDTQLFYVTSVPILRTLLALGLDVNARDKAGRTALWNQIGYPDVVQLLLDAGIDVNAQDRHGCTIMHRVAGSAPAPQLHSTYLFVVELLLNYGADLSIRAKSDFTPVDEAKAYYEVLLARLLTRRCAKLL